MKRFILLGCLLITGNLLLACDVCSNYIGANPDYNKNAFGIRYRSAVESGVHDHNAAGHSEMNAGGMGQGGHGGHGMSTMDMTPKSSTLIYDTYSLWFRWYFLSKVQVNGQLRYIDNTLSTEGGGSEKFSSLGDATLNVQYQLFGSAKTDSSLYKHRLFAGVGLKLPTGKYEITDDDGVVNQMMQPGTGSYDPIFVVNYMARLKRWGWTNNATYVISTANNNNYEFGDRANVTSVIFHKIPHKRLTIMPSTGVYWEVAGKDMNNDMENHNTGGNGLFNQSGLSLFYMGFNVNAAIQIPIKENLNGEQTKVEQRLVFGVGYAF